MARKFTRITPTTDNEVSKPKPRPKRGQEANTQKEEKKGGLLNRNKTTKNTRNTRPTKEEKPNNKLQNKLKRKPKDNLEIEQKNTQQENRVKEENSKPFSVPAYLGYETLDTSVAEAELDMYTKLLLKTVKKKNSLGSINLVPLGKVSEDIEKIVAEFVYRGGGMDDDLLTEDDMLSTRTETKSSRVKAL